MLHACGYESFEDMFKIIPDELKLKDALKLPAGKSELETRRFVSTMADKNKVFPHIFRGAGAYNHYVPSMVKNVLSKENLQTAYTPYQAEISQGILQSIFEYQTTQQKTKTQKRRPKRSLCAMAENKRRL